MRMYVYPPVLVNWHFTTAFIINDYTDTCNGKINKQGT